MGVDDFCVGNRVKIVRTNSLLDNRQGMIIGVTASFPDMKYYILLMDEPLVDNNPMHKGLSMTQHCLEKILNG